MKITKIQAQRLRIDTENAAWSSLSSQIKAFLEDHISVAIVDNKNSSIYSETSLIGDILLTIRNETKDMFGDCFHEY